MRTHRRRWRPRVRIHPFVEGGRVSALRGQDDRVLCARHDRRGRTERHRDKGLCTDAHGTLVAGAMALANKVEDGTPPDTVRVSTANGPVVSAESWRWSGSTWSRPPVSPAVKLCAPAIEQ